MAEMSRPSLSVVVPAYRSGMALWAGISSLLRWRHPAISRLRLVVVDDGSPAGALKQGTVEVREVELHVIVHTSNLGQSAATLSGYQSCATDWVVFLEDDLLDWPTVVEAMVDQLAAGCDLVNLARASRTGARTGRRVLVQPLVTYLFRRLSGCQLVDPTSPLKAVRRAAFEDLDLGLWRDCLLEGFAAVSGSSREIHLGSLTWDERPSRYPSARRVRMGLGLAHCLLRHRLRR